MKMVNKKNKNSKNKEVISFILISLISLIFLLFFNVNKVGADLTNSSSYSIYSLSISNGGTNTTSTNYISDFLLNEISGGISSLNYGISLGFWHSTKNMPPTIELLNPEDNNVTNDRTPTLTYQGTDPEGNSLIYDINITGVGFSADNRYETNYIGESYTPSPDLRYLADNNDYYEWTVRTCENETDELYCSDWATPRKINITSLVIISLTTDSINFGEMAIEEIKNTTIDSPEPFKMENQGNCYINVSLNATQLWDSVNYEASNYFQAKIREYIGNATWAETIWFQLPPITGLITAVDSLNYSSGSDTLKTDILLEVPPEEPAGSKSSQINFKASLAEYPAPA